MNEKRKSKLNNKGAAMVLTIIIMAILIVFVFSLILVSYNLYASQNKNLASSRNSEAVNTLSLAIKGELTDENASNTSNIWKYVRTNVAYTPEQSDYAGFDGWKDWPYYDASGNDADHSAEKAFRYFTLDNNPHIEGMPAETTVCMYWTLPLESDGVTEISEKTLFDRLSGGGNPKGVRLHVVIKAETGGQVYETEDIYRLTAKNTNTPEEIINVNKLFKNDSVYDVCEHYPNNLSESNPADDLTEKWTWKYEGRK